MEIQTLVVSDSELNRLTTEAGLGAITFTTADGLTIPIHHFDVSSSIDDTSERSPCAGNLYEAPGVDDDRRPQSASIINVVSRDHNDPTMSSSSSLSSIGTTITLDVTEMLAMANGMTSESAANVIRRLIATSALEADCNVDNKQAVDRQQQQQQEFEEIRQLFDSTSSTNPSSDSNVPVGHIQDDQLSSARSSSPRIKTPAIAGDRGGAGDGDGDFVVNGNGVIPSGNVVVIDISEPIQLAQNSLIVVNGKKCLLQQNVETGQLIAYPIKEMKGPPKKRGRPKKLSKEPDLTDVSNPAEKMLADVEQHPAACTADDENIVHSDVTRSKEAETKVKGLVEIANEDGEIVRRSSRQRKGVILKEYETGQINIDDLSEDEELIMDSAVKAADDDDDDDVDAMLPMKKRRPRKIAVTKKPRKKIKEHKTVTITKSGKKRGRPRRYPPPAPSPLSSAAADAGPSSKLTPKKSTPDNQSFLVQLVDGQTIVMHVPMANMPEGVTVQTIAQSIADSLNAATSVSQEGVEKNQLDLPSEISIMNPTGKFSNNLSDLIEIRNNGSIDTETASCSNVLEGQKQLQEASSTVVVQMVAPAGLQAKQNPKNDAKIVTPSYKSASHQVDAASSKPQSLDVAAVPMKPSRNYVQSVIPLESSDAIDNELPTPDTIGDKPIRIGLKKMSPEILDKLRCSKCQFQAFYSKQLQDHLASSHTWKELFPCKCCGHLTLSKEETIEHIKSRHPKNICSTCNYHAYKVHIVKRHMAIHNASVKPAVCEHCGKTYKNPYIMKIHIRNVHLPAEFIFECQLCGKKFTRKAHLIRHLRLHDPEMRTYSCSICEYKSFERSDVTKHQLVHEEPKHSCNVCGKIFRHIKNKELHLKRHTGQRDYKCGICEYLGYTFTDVRRHIERRHTDPKTITCDKCGQVFNTKELIKHHEVSGQCEMFRLEQALYESEPADIVVVDDDDDGDLRNPEPAGVTQTVMEDKMFVTDEPSMTTKMGGDILDLPEMPTEEDDHQKLVIADDGHFEAIFEGVNNEGGVQKEHHQQRHHLCTMITVDGKVINNIVMDSSQLARYTDDNDNDNVDDQ